MNKNIIEILKDYLDETDLEIEEVDIREKTIEEIKSNLVDFADYFLRYFNSFYKTFRNCKKKKVIEFIDKNKKHFEEVLKLHTNYKEYSIEYGKEDVKIKLIEYLQKNYFEINYFFDVCFEVNEE